MMHFHSFILSGRRARRIQYILILNTSYAIRSTSYESFIIICLLYSSKRLFFCFIYVEFLLPSFIDFISIQFDFFITKYIYIQLSMHKRIRCIWWGMGGKTDFFLDSLCFMGCLPKALYKNWSERANVLW